MRTVAGLILMVGVALAGLENVSQSSALAPATGAAVAQSAQLASVTPAVYDGPSFMRTIAVADRVELPAVDAAPLAPKAAPINPIVAPVQRVVPKATAGKPATAAVKSKTAKAASAAKSSAKAGKDVIVTRPGFKLACTSAQTLDVARQKCVANKGAAVAAAKKPKA
jgi:hypothetical protein